MGSRTGCLIIHGFGGSISEVSPLAEHLENLGYTVCCPALEGHTGRRKDLKGVGYKAWIRSAEEGMKELQARCEKIVLIGFSMGGLIAFNLALKYEVSAVITINTPIYYWDLKIVAANILRDLKERRLTNINRYLQSSVKLPFSALISFRLLLEKTRTLLKHIRCPLYVLQGIDDDTVRRKSACFIIEKAASASKKLDFYENSGHQMLRSMAAGKAIQDISAFLYDLRNG